MISTLKGVHVRILKTKCCRRNAAQPRTLAAKRPKPWVGDEESTSPARATRPACIALAGLNLNPLRNPGLHRPLSRALPPRAALRRAFSARAARLFFVGGFLLIPMLSLPIAQGAEEAPRREESQFGIYVAGKEIGNEQFSILNSADTIESKSVVSFRDPGGKHKKVRMETELSMDSHFLPRTYQLRTDVEGQKGMIIGTFAPGEATFEYKSSGNPLKRALLVGAHCIILDTNVFHHFIFIARLFNMRSGGAQYIEAVIPQELNGGKLKVSEVGLERTSIHGKKMDLHHLNADSGLLLIDLWIDDQQIVYKIALPAKKIEVIRNH
jgi:hypothetical protein